jgi:hypothetical protein
MDLRDRGCNAVRRKSAAKKRQGGQRCFAWHWHGAWEQGWQQFSHTQIAWAQDPPPVRIRGTIERVDGATLVIKARDGAELKVTVVDNPQIAGIIKASLSDIKQNSFVGVTAMPQPDGSLNAVEVHIFPESMRGTGEGHYPWDLQPQSTMTNSNVEQVVSAVDGRTLTLKYKDGEKKITVPANAPIVTYVPGDKSDIKPGAKVFIVAAKQADGTLLGRAWRPPM